MIVFIIIILIIIIMFVIEKNNIIIIYHFERGKTYKRLDRCLGNYATQRLTVELMVCFMKHRMGVAIVPNRELGRERGIHLYAASTQLALGDHCLADVMERKV